MVWHNSTGCTWAMPTKPVILQVFIMSFSIVIFDVIQRIAALLGIMDFAGNLTLQKMPCVT